MKIILKKTLKTLTRFRNLKPKKLKNIIPEDYIKIQKNTKPFLTSKLSDLIAKSQKYDPKNPKKGLLPTEQPIPISPILGPIRVQRPKVGSKVLWCSCGMSSKQPYCDGSHKMTAFKPMEFVVEEPVEWVFYCGCKFSEDKPFCDGKTCLEIQGVEIEENEN